MKSYTDLEQSRKLAEILPIESADMHWQYIEEDNGQLQWFCFPKDFSINKHNTVLAWSLAALLEIIPSEIFSGEYIINITEGLDNKWCITYDNIDNKNHSFYGLSSSADNLIDVCYEIILELYERKLL